MNLKFSFQGSFDADFTIIYIHASFLFQLLLLLTYKEFIFMREYLKASVYKYIYCLSIGKPHAFRSLESFRGKLQSRVARSRILIYARLPSVVLG